MKFQLFGIGLRIYKLRGKDPRSALTSFLNRMEIRTFGRIAHLLMVVDEAGNKSYFDTVEMLSLCGLVKQVDSERRVGMN